MAKAKAVKITIRAVPGRSSQTVSVRGAGQTVNHLLLGKVVATVPGQPLISATTPELYLSALLTQAQAIVLSS